MSNHQGCSPPHKHFLQCKLRGFKAYYIGAFAINNHDITILGINIENTYVTDPPNNNLFITYINQIYFLIAIFNC